MTDLSSRRPLEGVPSQELGEGSALLTETTRGITSRKPHENATRHQKPHENASNRHGAVAGSRRFLFETSPLHRMQLRQVAEVKHGGLRLASRTRFPTLRRLEAHAIEPNAIRPRHETQSPAIRLPPCIVAESVFDKPSLRGW